MTADERTYALGRIQGEAYVCAQGVAQQATRLRDNRQCGPEFMADGRMLAVLLRNVVRAAVAARPFLSGSHLSEVDAALDRVDAACPYAVAARDALEHFDDYVLGIGRRQQRHPGEYAQRYERGGPVSRVRVGDLVLDVDIAEQAAIHLASVLLVGKDHLGLLSPNTK